MRLTPPAACLLTAVATAASVYVTRSITNESVSNINPLFAAIGGFVIPAYGLNLLGKTAAANRSKPVHLQKSVTIAVLAFVVPVLAILWIGGRDHAYKVQMGTMFVVLGVCCIALVPAAFRTATDQDS